MNSTSEMSTSAYRRGGDLAVQGGPRTALGTSSSELSGQLLTNQFIHQSSSNSQEDTT